jgi:integrase
MAVTQNHRGRWEADFRDQNGKRKQKHFDTKKEAEDWLLEKLGKVRKGTYVSDSKATIGEKADEWHDRKKATKGYRYITLKNWEIHIRDFIKPELGGLSIQQATMKVIEMASLKWAERSSANNANMVLKTLTAIFFLAQRYGPLDPQGTNVAKMAERIKLPTEDTDDGEVMPEDVLSGEQLGRLVLATEPGSLDRICVELGGFCGLRIGEILGFTWPAIDLKSTSPKVRVIKNLVPVEKEKADFPGYRNTGRSLKDPKSKAGRRTLDAPSQLVHDLKLWKLQCPHTAQQIVMATVAGVPLQVKKCQSMLDAACERAEVPRITLHRLRHTFASLLLMRGEALLEVSRLLGHRDVAVTARVYAHFIDQKRTAVQDLVRASWERANESSDKWRPRCDHCPK